MKKLTFTSFLALCSLNSSYAVAQVNLTDQQKILSAINRICGDTWCEGDYNFHFLKVIQNTTTNSTAIHFKMNLSYPITDDSNPNQNFQANINKQSFEVSCNIPGYSTYLSVVNQDLTLNSDFYSSLTDCIQNLETRLAKIN